MDVDGIDAALERGEVELVGGSFHFSTEHELTIQGGDYNPIMV